MGSRNTFVTKFIYGKETIQTIRPILEKYTKLTEFIGQENGGFFTGIIKTSGIPPYEEVNEIFREIDIKLKEIGYDINFDLAVVCDDEDVILSKDFWP